ncbi:MAG: hypothetical protein PWP23_2481 [Candidatus Sumerlaeota bacterium]|nr:hypothetical protein [Candidatus Sumerlaeota bacterium]
MRLAGHTVRRPVMTTMFTLIVIVLGTVALTRLPIDLMPEVTYPTLSVSTSYGNASPEEMETLITEYIEEAVSAVPGVEEVTSESGEGSSNVRIRFAWGTDLDVASNDVRDRIDRILDDLPDDAERPQLRKFDVAAFPIVVLGVFSDLDPLEQRQLVDEQVQYRIEQIVGVAATDVWGGLEREVQINLDYEKIKALAIPLDQILQRLRESNINLPAGTIERGNTDVTIRTPGEFRNLGEIASTIVAFREGAPIQLGQIASIEDTHARVSRIVRINGKPGIRLAVRKQSGTNTVEVTDRVLSEVEKLNTDFPQLNIVPVIDTSQYIRRSISNVRSSVLIGGILAIVVLFLFLGSIRSTLVISLAIPISIIASFALMYFCGFTLNLMTLGGLALGVGMMVDNSIVVLENIYRLKQEGAPPEEAAIHGADEVTAAIIASTLTTLVIFLPLLLIEGISGVLFGQLAYVVAFSLVCSLVVAITLVPMLAARLLSFGDSKRPGLLVRLSTFAFKGLETLYGDFLDLCLKLRWLVMPLVVGLCAASFLLVPKIGTEFLPPSDEGEVRVDVEMEVGTRLELLEDTMLEIEKIVTAEVPEARHTVVQMGASSWRPGGASTGNIQVAIGPAKDRTRSSEDIANALRSKLQGIPGAKVTTRASRGLRVLRLGQGDNDIEIDIYGFDFAGLDELAARVQEGVATIPGITDVEVSREAGVPQEVIRIDRERAADLGLTINLVARTLETALSGSRAGNYREAGDEYRILVKLSEAEKLSIEDVLDLTISNSSGEPVVLRNVVSIEPALGPQVIERKNQKRLAVVEANYADRDLGEIAADIQDAIRQIPHSEQYQILISGDYEEQQKSFRDLMISLLVAIVLVYMVLASLYESLIDPLVVMFSVPLAAIGVLVTLFLTDTTFNNQSFIGCIMLGGIVVNNAILLVDQTTELRTHHGYGLRPAIVEAGRRRLRPILMTTLTTVLGLLPLALGIGEGADQQAPLARAVIGGLASSTLITLVFIPIVYSLVHGRLRSQPAADASTSPPADAMESKS